MEVEGWPFNSIRNKLVIHVSMDSSSGNSDGSDCTAVEVGESTSLQWLKIFLNGVTLYLFFLSFFLSC